MTTTDDNRGTVHQCDAAATGVRSKPIKDCIRVIPKIAKHKTGRGNLRAAHGHAAAAPGQNLGDSNANWSVHASSISVWCDRMLITSPSWIMCRLR